MKVFNNIILSIFSIMMSLNAISQDHQIDLKLANNYFIEGDFEKAIMYFEKLENNKELLPTIYNYYKAALLELNRYKVAEKLCKSMSKNYPENLAVFVDLGEIYELLGNNKKAIAFYDKPISLLTNQTSFSDVSETGIAFEKKGDLERALALYKKANSVNNGNPQAFHTKMAYVLSKQGKYQEMINLYIEILSTNDNFLSMVQSGLSSNIDFETQVKEKELLRKSLIKKIQSQPKKLVFLELLIWYYMLNNNFEAAFQQVVALDKKTNKDGFEVLNLGKSALNNSHFEAAIMSFDYVIENTNSPEKIYLAETLKLKALKQKLIYNQDFSTTELMELKSNYLKTLYKVDQNTGVHQNIINRKYDLLVDLAELEAYYFNNTSEAKNYLSKALILRGISESNKGKINMLMADLLVLENNIWEASLMYLKVEKQFKEDPLGHQAKFNNAKVYYYAGEFDWCQAQLDVLKASTSKLIANDALALSVLITDNYNMDTSDVAMKLFAKADMLFAQQKLDEALAVYDSVFNMFSQHSLNDEILLRKSEIYKTQKNINSAIESLKKIENEFPNSIILDKALFNIATLYENQLKEIELAKSYYKKILFEHPSSLYVVDSRKRFRKLSGKTNQNIIKDS